jgi:hypothetical protein
VFRAQEFIAAGWSQTAVIGHVEEEFDYPLAI